MDENILDFSPKSVLYSNFSRGIWRWFCPLSIKISGLKVCYVTILISSKIVIDMAFPSVCKSKLYLAVYKYTSHFAADSLLCNGTAARKDSHVYNRLHSAERLSLGC